MRQRAIAAQVAWHRLARGGLKALSVKSSQRVAIIVGDDDKTWTRRRLIERCLAPEPVSSIARLESHIR